MTFHSRTARGLFPGRQEASQQLIHGFGQMTISFLADGLDAQNWWLGDGHLDPNLRGMVKGGFSSEHRWIRVPCAKRSTKSFSFRLANREA